MNEATTAVDTTAADARRARLRWTLMAGGVAVALVAAVWYYLHSGRYVSTDNSMVRAAQMAVSSNVAGRVVEVAVHDNQVVHKGDVLFRLDDRPLRIALEEAQAKLAVARMQIAAARASYRHSEVEVATADNTMRYQQSEFERQQRLLKSGISSRAQFDQSQHARDLARQQVSSAQQSLGTVAAMLQGSPGTPIEQHPLVLLAQAAVDSANLDLSYATIRAADEGVVTKVEQLQVGDYISAATPVFALVSTHDVWVEANFKESELTFMRPGQAATVRIDAYPGRIFHARVASLSPGTGSQFSVLPAENATGNWVKVVQRLPVRLQLDAREIDESIALHSGLSADVEVDTRHQRHLFGGSDTQVARSE
jgi:membrane fusion protein (multidrug efflux system)